MTQIRCCFCKAPAAFNCFDALLCAEHFLSVVLAPSDFSSPEVSAPAAVAPKSAAAGAVLDRRNASAFRVAASSLIQESSSDISAAPACSMFGTGHGAIVSAHNSIVRGE